MVTGGTYGGRTMTSSDKDYYDAWTHKNREPWILVFEASVWPLEAVLLH